MEENNTSIEKKEFETPIEAVETSIENTAETVAEDDQQPVVATPKEIIDPNNKYSKESLQNVEAMLKNVSAAVQTMESMWNASRRELHIDEPHIRELYQWNEQHKTPMPEGLTEKEQNEWDHFNGLDLITEEEVTRIFGEGHPIFGVDMAQTIDRIKGAVNDFFSWIVAMRQFTDIHDAYMKLLEEGEKENIEKLKVLANDEQDPEKKAKYQAAIDKYYNQKYLQFLTDPIDEKDIKRIVNVIDDEKKIEYWINRSRDKLKQLKFSSMFILELSQFEKRFMNKKYHCNSQILLIYFMQKLIFDCNLNDPKSDGRTEIVCMLFGLDSVIRNTADPFVLQIIMHNLELFEDQFLPYMKDKYPVEETTEEESNTMNEENVDMATEEDHTTETTVDENDDLTTEEVIPEETTDDDLSEALPVDESEEEEDNIPTKDDTVGVEYPNPFEVSMDSHPEIYQVYLDCITSDNPPINTVIKRYDQKMEVTIGKTTTALPMSEIMNRCENEVITFKNDNLVYRVAGCTSMSFEEYSDDGFAGDVYKEKLKAANKLPIGHDVKIGFKGVANGDDITPASNVIEHSFREWCIIPLINQDTGATIYPKAVDIFENFAAYANYFRYYPNVDCIFKLAYAVTD